MLYHYTDAEALAAIEASGEIRPHKIRVTRDLFPHDNSEWLTIGPIVWLSSNPILDGTVVTKMCHGDLAKLRRIVLPADYCEIGLADYCDLHGIDKGWMDRMVQTGALVGSHYSTWRLHDRPIPQEDWISVDSHPWG